MDTQHSISLAS